MCGICGIISKNKISIENLKKMNDSMKYRGPDDSGEEVYKFGEERYIGMAQRRLSIVDLSEKGHQPFHSKSSDVIVVFNGEIYNFQELKEELSDYIFVSDCDTEVIIACYKKWGENFVEHIDGMFAIALFDVSACKLILTRDRVGKKPLYYYQEDDVLVFASTLKPIMEYEGFIKSINKDVIPRFLYNRYIAGEECIFENVSKVKPGEIIILNNNKLIKRDYWNLLIEYEKYKLNKISDYKVAKKELNDKLIESVQKRMVADVPVGAFLSGGYDSSLVTAIAQSLCTTKLKTFSIGFEDEEYNEAPFAEAIAKYLGTDHTSYYVSEEKMLDLVNSIPEYYDEPFADSSQIPSMLVAEIAKKDVTVVLTGDGGDEFFCGYNVYDKIYLAQRLEKNAEVLRVILKNKGEVIEKLPFAIKAIVENDNKKHKTQFGRREYEKSISKILDSDSKVIPYDESIIIEKEWQIKRMLLDSITYLPENNLCKVDRATMKYSLEARNPLLDVSVINTAFRIPHCFKYRRKEKKFILKELTYEYIPEKLLKRPKKGFAVPIDKWLRGALKEELLSLTSEEYLLKQGIFDSVYTSQYVQTYVNSGDKGVFSGNNASNIVWPLFMFQKWYQYYIE